MNWQKRYFIKDVQEAQLLKIKLSTWDLRTIKM